MLSNPTEPVHVTIPVADRQKSVELSEVMALEGRRRAGADNPAHGVAYIAEAVRQLAVEQVSFASSEHLNLIRHGDLNFALGHDPRFFTYMGQQFGPGVGIWWISFVENL